MTRKQKRQKRHTDQPARRNPTPTRYALYSADDRKDLKIEDRCLVDEAGYISDLRARGEWRSRPSVIVERDRDGGRIVESNRIDQRIDP